MPQKAKRGILKCKRCRVEELQSFNMHGYIFYFVFLQVQMNPSPTNPCLQWQLYDLLVLKHIASLSQRLVCPFSHSLTSVKKVERVLNQQYTKGKFISIGFFTSSQLYQSYYGIIFGATLQLARSFMDFITQLLLQGIPY